MRVLPYLLALSALPAFGQQNLLNTLQITLVTDQIHEPTSITNAGDGSDRLFVTERAGRIWILDSNRQLLGTPFLDIHTRVGSVQGEQGLLSVAFHPNYKSNGRFFVNYTDLSGNTVVSQFTVSGLPNVADSGSEVIYFTAFQPQTNHNGGQLQFGPDGMLYVGMGDGGGGGDKSNYAQTLSSPLGKMLRFNIDQGAPAKAPPDNPFVGTNAYAGVWSYGLRNPWRFSFDRATGDLWIADVGQEAWEEVNFSRAGSTKGLNYGWRLMEGAHCYDPPSNCNPGGLTLPVMEYSHPGGCSVTGGYRYRGAANPSMRGVYFFADLCASRLEGGVETSPGVFQRLTPRTGVGALSAFGEDEAGELYMAAFYDWKIYRLDSPSQAIPGSSRIGIYRSGHWELDADGNGSLQGGSDFFHDFGFAGAQRISGDFNGDGQEEVGVFYDGFWFLDFNANGKWDGSAIDRGFEFGWAGVSPVTGDWNGNGKETVGIVVNGFWFLDVDGDGIWDGPGSDIQAEFGFNGMTPKVGDWNGDGRDKIGFYANGFWYLDLNGNAAWDGPGTDRSAHFGFAGVTPLVGDWNGNGRESIGIYGNGFWYLDANGDGVWDGPGQDIQAAFGSSALEPVVGDWNGDGKDKIGVYSNGLWYLDVDGSGGWDGGASDKAYSFGQAGDLPVVGVW